MFITLTWKELIPEEEKAVVTIMKTSFVSGETLDLDLERVAFGNKHCYELVSDYGPMRSDFRYLEASFRFGN